MLRAPRDHSAPYQKLLATATRTWTVGGASHGRTDTRAPGQQGGGFKCVGHAHTSLKHADTYSQASVHPLQPFLTHLLNPGLIHLPLDVQSSKAGAGRCTNYPSQALPQRQCPFPTLSQWGRSNSLKAEGGTRTGNLERGQSTAGQKTHEPQGARQSCWGQVSPAIRPASLRTLEGAQ